MKANDIPDRRVLAVLATTPYWQPCDASGAPVGERRALAWHNRGTLRDAFPEYPEKVVVAKVRQLHKRGLVEGCLCGCRGDFELNDKGRALLG